MQSLPVWDIKDKGPVMMPGFLGGPAQVIESEYMQMNIADRARYDRFLVTATNINRIRRGELRLGDKPKWYWFECEDCGFDSDEAHKLSPELGEAICPVCAGDSGHDVYLRFREATQEEVDRINVHQR